MAFSSRLSPGQFGIAWAAVFAAILVLDGLWLGFLAKDLYKREMGSLMADSVRIVPAIVFYVLYPAALVYLTLLSPPSGWAEAAIRGLVLGLAAYGAYDLTNLAVVRDWSLRISLIDWAWGGFLSAASAACGYAATWSRT